MTEWLQCAVCMGPPTITPRPSRLVGQLAWIRHMLWYQYPRDTQRVGSVLSDMWLNRCRRMSGIALTCKAFQRAFISVESKSDLILTNVRYNRRMNCWWSSDSNSIARNASIVKWLLQMSSTFQQSADWHHPAGMSLNHILRDVRCPGLVSVSTPICSSHRPPTVSDPPSHLGPSLNYMVGVVTLPVPVGPQSQSQTCSVHY